jgi:hypothetical protein
MVPKPSNKYKNTTPNNNIIIDNDNNNKNKTVVMIILIVQKDASKKKAFHKQDGNLIEVQIQMQTTHPQRTLHTQHTHTTHTHTHTHTCNTHTHTHSTQHTQNTHTRTKRRGDSFRNFNVEIVINVEIKSNVISGPTLKPQNINFPLHHINPYQTTTL